jgi:hypothetical protein
LVISTFLALLTSLHIAPKSRLIKRFEDALLCRYSSGLRIAPFGVMLKRLKWRWNMSPLMWMMLISLVPFPVLAIVILADRWLKTNHEAIS